MDVNSRPEPPGVSAYPRAAVDEFLASGELEAHRLEQAIAEAHIRAERATFVTERAEAISEMLHSILQDLRREFADRRLQVEAQAEGLVTAAHDEAARLLADARRDAIGATAATPAPLTPTTTDTAVPTPSYRWAAVPSTTYDEPAPTSVSVSVGRAGQPSELGTNGETAPPAGSSAVSTVAPAPVTTAPAAGNGAGTRPAVVGRPVATGDDTTTIDLTADAQERRRAGLGRLRRSRRRDTPPDTGDDEFLDYLRGALVDDAPLHRESDHEPPVDWRWTS